MPLVNTHINDTQLFHDLKAMDRDNFSYEGAKALMEYLDNLADECDMNIEYDPIAFCCEYSEYTDALDCINSAGYDVDFSECEDEHDKQETAIEYLEENTQVIGFNGGIIIADF